MIAKFSGNDLVTGLLNGCGFLLFEKAGLFVGNGAAFFDLGQRFDHIGIQALSRDGKVFRAS